MLGLPSGFRAGAGSRTCILKLNDFNPGWLFIKQRDFFRGKASAVPQINHDRFGRHHTSSSVKGTVVHVLN
jgi:hypothetical protein